jgi:hypothetical protein
MTIVKRNNKSSFVRGSRRCRKDSLFEYSITDTGFPLLFYRAKGISKPSVKIHTPEVRLPEYGSCTATVPPGAISVFYNPHRVFIDTEHGASPSRHRTEYFDTKIVPPVFYLRTDYIRHSL